MANIVVPLDRTKLTAKMKTFCHEYMVDFNGKQAYIRAGYSEKHAACGSYEILKKQKIRDYIDRLKIERAQRVGYTSDTILKRLVEIDNLDVVDIVDDDGQMLPVRDWPPEWRRSISGLTVTEMQSGDIQAVIKSIRWPDKLKNLELLGRHIAVGAWKTEAEKSSGAEALVHAFNTIADKLPK